ncbi:hypothetical protein N7457_001378 [Penicillium paradoxum]|uniref:uncharacterized protein n=1 Tax=Penicillium paradoxum TaxID=176176 RepID=UPI0025479E65|nr:uncharacterized protein N7457_001378 [Penicillium paradoxum]KAJ5794779.1 hypothetical protein N7457_001378 [Penicillium paradoxum]
MVGCAPSWVWRYKQKALCLQDIDRELRHMEPGFISNEYCDIDIHPMDFWTGDTDPSFIQYFIPDIDTEVQIDNTALNPEDPLDDPFTWARETKENKDTFGSQEMHHSLHAAFSKYIRKSPNGHRPPVFWDPVSMREEASLFNSNDRHGFTIESAATCADSKAAHQLVVMKSDRCYHKFLPAIGELVVLLRWMLDAINKHKRYLGRKQRHKSPQHDFPTMVISFLPDARVRILQGYFDDGQLKVAYTQALDFDTEDYADKMDTLLQWAWPIVDGDTTKPIPLPAIEDDEEDEWDEWEKWELRYREESEDEDSSDLGSEADDCSTEEEDSPSDWESDYDEEDESDEEENTPIAIWSDEETFMMSEDIKQKNEKNWRN